MIRTREFTRTFATIINSLRKHAQKATPEFTAEVNACLQNRRDKMPVLTDKRKEVESKLMETSGKMFGGNLKLHAYGSSVSGLSLEDSDLDFMAERVGIEMNVDDLERMVKDAGFDVVHKVTNSRVPLVKYYDPKTGIDGDVTLNNLAVVYNTKLMKAYADISPTVSDFICLLKLWTRRKGLSNARHMMLCSYGWTLFALHFLQFRENMIANIQTSYIGERKFIKAENRGEPVELEVSFITNERKLNMMLLHNRLTPADLLLRFLLYACVDFQQSKSGISIKRTGVFSRSKFDQPEFTRDYLILEDPIENYRNIASSVHSSAWHVSRATGLHALVLYKKHNSFNFLIEQ